MRERKNLIPVIFIIIISASYIFLFFQHDWLSSFPELLIVCALIISGLAVFVYMLENGKAEISAPVIIALAVLFRALFLFSDPVLSDDIFRYLWDGLQSLRGINPYALAPSAYSPSDPADIALLLKVNHPQYITIYPPAAQLVFAAGAAINHSVLGMKFLLTALDCLTCIVAIMVLNRTDIPFSRAILYAWHPLPVIEIAGSGHVDGAAILFFMLSLYFLAPPNCESDDTSGLQGLKAQTARYAPLLAGAAIGTAVLIKLMALIYLPFIFLYAKDRLRFITGFAISMTLLSLPFCPGLYRMTGTLVAYLNNWEFSNYIFRFLRDSTGSGSAARIILMSAFVSAVIIIILYMIIKSKKPSLQTSSGPLFIALYAAAFCFLLFSPTLYPWYALYLVGIFPLVAGAGGMAMGFGVFLSYYVIIKHSITGSWIESDPISALIWFSAAGAALIAFAIKLFLYPDRIFIFKSRRRSLS